MWCWDCDRFCSQAWNLKLFGDFTYRWISITEVSIWVISLICCHGVKDDFNVSRVHAGLPYFRGFLWYGYVWLDLVTYREARLTCIVIDYLAESFVRHTTFSSDRCLRGHCKEWSQTMLEESKSSYVSDWSAPVLGREGPQSLSGMTPIEQIDFKPTASTLLPCHNHRSSCAGLKANSFPQDNFRHRLRGYVDFWCSFLYTCRSQSSIYFQ